MQYIASGHSGQSIFSLLHCCVNTARKDHGQRPAITAQEAAFDARVYRLYGLTAAEIKIVESNG